MNKYQQLTMSDYEMDTETSTFDTQHNKSVQNSKASQQTIKKKRKKSKQIIYTSEVKQEQSTARKQPTFVQIQYKKTLKERPKKAMPHSGINGKKQTLFVYQCCDHSSVYKKFILSLIFSLISMALFSQPPRINYPLAHFQEGKHEQVFQIVTDKLTMSMQFNYEHKKELGLFVTSTKTARVKAAVNYTLGYQFQYSARNGTEQQKEHVSVEMSDLKVLSYAIFDVVLENKQDGFWNSWTFEDHENLIAYIKQHFIEEMKQNAVRDIPDHKKQTYETKAQKMLGQIINKYESWFDWLLKRIDQYIDVGLAPYVKNFQIVYGREAVQNK